MFWFLSEFRHLSGKQQNHRLLPAGARGKCGKPNREVNGMRANLEPAVSLGCVTIGEKHVVLPLVYKTGPFLRGFYTPTVRPGAAGVHSRPELG